MLDHTCGSSPLARGTLGLRRPRDGQSRFIPTRAGNTISPSAIPRTGSVQSPLARGTGATYRLPNIAAVHPHSRGESRSDPPVSIGQHIARPEGRAPPPLAPTFRTNRPVSSPLAPKDGRSDFTSTAPRFIPTRAVEHTPPPATRPRSSSPLAPGTLVCSRFNPRPVPRRTGATALLHQGQKTRV